MAKKKRKESSRPVRRLAQALAGLALLTLILWAASPVAMRLSQEKEISSLRSQQSHIRRQNRGLRSQIVKLRNDPEYLELLARRNLGLVKSDEEAYVVLEPPVVAVEEERAPERAGLLPALKARLLGW